jgi:RNA polymerase sigma-70 factor (ECF subfamily)
MESGMDDRGDLLARCQQGDPDAFDLLVSEMAPRLKGYFLRQGAEAATADDLAQNVFVRVLQSLDRYRPAGQMSAYFLRIARNLWIDHTRRAWRLRRVEDQPEASDGRPGPVEIAEIGDRAARVRAALGELDRDARELLELAVLQKLPYKDVAAILDVPVGTVKSRVFYALRRLRERLAACEEEER